MMRSHAAALAALAALAGCSTKETQTLDETASFDLGPSGGTATSPDGRVTLELAAGALSGPTTIRVGVDKRANAYASPVYAFEPSGTTFARPVKVSVQMPSAGPWVLANVDGPTPVRVAGSSYDPATGAVQADLQHFSTYAVVSSSADGGAVGPDAGIVPGACGEENQGPAPQPPGPDGGLAQGSSWTFCSLAEAEPNDTQATAQATGLTIDHGVEVDATWDGSDDVFTFEIPAGRSAKLIAETFDETVDCPVTTDLDTVTALLGPQGNVLAEGEAGWFRCGSVDYQQYPNLGNLTAGSYAVRVGFRTTFGTTPLGRRYKLRIWLLSTP